MAGVASAGPAGEKVAGASGSQGEQLKVCVCRGRGGRLEEILCSGLHKSNIRASSEQGKKERKPSGEFGGRVC